MRERSAVVDIWAYRETEWSAMDLIGFDVEASDGHVGTVDEATSEIGTSYLVVKTGLPLVGKRVLLPAGMISSIDEDERTIQVALTKDEIKQSPEFDEADYRSPAYRDRLGAYYANRPPGPDYGKDDLTF
jgi:hypothetical protein